jgi:hypothetical protein
MLRDDESTTLGNPGVKRMGAARVRELIALINREHEHGEHSMADGISRWIACGRMLVELRQEVRDVLGPCNWERWVDQSSGLHFGHRMALKYVKLYRQREDLKAKRESGIPVTSIQQAINLLADPAKKKTRKPRPRASHNSRGMHAFEFERPDLASVIRHLNDQWYGQIASYEPDEEQLALLDADLPKLLPALAQLAEVLGLDAGVRLTAPPMPPTVLEAEAVVVDGVLTEIESVPDLAQAHAHYLKALAAQSRAIQVADLDALLRELDLEDFARRQRVKTTEAPGGARRPRAV